MSESKERKSYKAFQEQLSKVTLKREGRWRITYSEISYIYLMTENSSLFTYPIEKFKIQKA